MRNRAFVFPIPIFNALLTAAGINPANDLFTTKLSILKQSLVDQGVEKSAADRIQLDLCKEMAEKELGGLIAFALSRAVEIEEGLLTKQALIEEVLEYNIASKTQASFNINLLLSSIKESVPALKPIDQLLDIWRETKVAISLLQNILQKKFTNMECLEMYSITEHLLISLEEVGVDNDKGEQCLLLLQQLYEKIQHHPELAASFKRIQDNALHYVYENLRLGLAFELGKLERTSDDLPRKLNTLIEWASKPFSKIESSELAHLINILNQHSTFSSSSVASSYVNQSLSLLESITRVALTQNEVAINVCKSHLISAVKELDLQKVDPNIQSLLQEQKESLLELLNSTVDFTQIEPSQKLLDIRNLLHNTKVQLKLLGGSVKSIPFIICK